MVKKQLRKLIFALLCRLPKPLRHAFFRSRLHIPPLSEDIFFEIAKTQRDLDQAFQLLHDAYVKEGYSKPHISRRRVTDYHALPSTTTLVAKWHEQVIATISVIRDGSFGLPADAVVDLSVFRNRGQRIGEVSSLAIKPEFRGRSGELMFHLFKYMLHYSMKYFGLDRFIIVVHPNRITLYESILAFELLRRETVKSYRFANNAPGVCATLNLTALAETFRQIYAGKPAHKNIYLFFFGGFSPTEKKQMRFPERMYHTAMDPVMTPGIMDYFFNQCTDSLCRLGERQISILQTIYNERAYDAVWPKNKPLNWKNQRAHPRFDVACSGTLSDQHSPPDMLRVLDASRTGMRVFSNAAINQEARTDLKISVGSRKNVRVQVGLRWHSGSIYGMEIRKSDPCWHQFIDYLENQILMTAQAVQSEMVDATIWI